MEFWIIRHGQTFGNLERIIQGQIDGQLTEIGEKQAKQTGKYLINHKFKYAYVSDQGRTRATYDNIMKSNKNLSFLEDVKHEKILREKDGGDLHGKPLNAFTILANNSGLGIRNYCAPNGESWVDVSDRAKNFFINVYTERVINNPQKNSQIEGRTNSEKFNKTLVITHGGWIMEMYNVINYCIAGSQPTFNNNAKNCAINVIKMYCKNTGSFCDKRCEGNTKCMVFKIMRRNDDNHITVH